MNDTIKLVSCACAALTIAGCGPTSGGLEAPRTSQQALGSETWQGGDRIVEMSADVEHTCALYDQGGVKCWGTDSRWQVSGVQTQGEIKWTPQMVKGLGAGVKGIATGEKFSCALYDEGWVTCWGMNNNGELGRGEERGNEGEIGPYVEGLGAGIVSIEAAGSHACALYDQGGIQCWGTTPDQVPSEESGGLPDGELRTILGLEGAATQLTTSSTFACALTDKGSTQCWGPGGFMLYYRTLMRRIPNWHEGVTQVESGTGLQTCAIREGRVWCFGFNGRGEVGDGTTDERHQFPIEQQDLRGVTVDVATASGATCALQDDGKVWCWGSNEYGKLGDGSQTDSAFPVEVEGLSAPATNIIAGGNHFCAILEDGTAMCWGDNNWGQLGVGEEVESSSTPLAIADEG